MNYSTILGITIGTLIVFMLVFVLFLIYFPIVSNFLFPFLQRGEKGSSEGIVILTPRNKEKLVEGMRPLPAATSSIFYEETKDILKEMTPQEDATPSLSQEQRENLLKAMTPKQ